MKNMKEEIVSDEEFDPSLSVQRSVDLYRAKGFDEKLNLFKE